MKIKILPLLTVICFPVWSIAQRVIPEQTPLDIALRYIEQEHQQWELTEEDITAMSVSDQYQTRHNQVTHLYFQQRYRNIPVYNAIAGVHITAEGAVAHATSRFVSNLESRINRTTPVISAPEALRKAVAHLALAVDAPIEIIGSRGETEFILSEAGIARQPVTARLVFQSVDDNTLRLAWDLSIDLLKSPDYWSLRIDAENGDLLHKGNYTLYCRTGANTRHFHQEQCFPSGDLHPAGFRPVEEALRGKMKAGKSENDFLLDAPLYHVFPVPVESPIHGERQIVIDPSDPEASPYGWHDTDGKPGAEYTITRGNNVHAFLDPSDADTSRMDEPNGGEALHFDFPFDANLEPGDYKEASVTQLFYMTNMMHDLAYHYGFDEAAGNFQQNNYNRGGKGGDPVRANAQDGGAVNNANFTAPPEGEPGRIQMYLWTQDRSNLFRITSPPEIAGNYEAATANFGPEISDSLITGEIVGAIDGTGNPTLACEEIVNSQEVEGKIAMIDRGSCFFEEKVRNAEEAGAIAVVICNFEDGLVNMGGVNDIPDPNIPSVMLKASDCARIRAFINQGAGAALQQQKFSGPDSLDGDFDNGVIAHEYAHGISLRLTGGPSTGGCLFNDEQMGEGWSDFFTLVTTYQLPPSKDTPRGIGNYVVRSNLTGSGVRLQPYSTDMSVNNKVFDDIIGTGTSQHDLGEIWTLMLWDLYWRFVEEYGWDPDLINGSGGNNLAIQLVMDGLKMQPCQPGFVEARDAIIAADIVNNGGANECLIWEVFARRGLGWSADQGVPTDRRDGFQAFDLMPECVKELKIAKSVTELIEPGEEITVTLTVTNHKDGNAGQVTVKDVLPSGTAYIGGSTSGDGVEAPEVSGGVLTFNLGDLAAGREITFSYRLSTAPDRQSVRQFFDDAENGDALWDFDALEGVGVWDLSDERAFSGENSWFVPNTSGENDQVLFPLDPIKVSGVQPVLRFYHLYDTEPGSDGGIIEISADGGLSWTPVLRDKIFKNSYRGKLDYQTFVLPFLDGYWGNSGDFVDTYVDLSDYTGQDILYRFRFGSVEDLPGVENDVTGWYIDDIEVMDMYNYNSEACVSSEQGDLSCTEAPFRGTIVQTGEFTDIDDPLSRPFDMRIYPNPAGDWINVALRTDAPTEAVLSLFSTDGRLIDQTRVDLIGNEQIVSLSSAGLPKGLYLVKLQTAGAIAVEKVIVD